MSVDDVIMKRDGGVKAKTVVFAYLERSMRDHS